jgi:DNA polymerase-3 subunit delta
MRIPSEQLLPQLKRGLAPLYTVFGDELLLALEAADRIRAKARADGYSEREVLTAEQHFDWSRLHMSVQSQSLFATRRILELRIPNGKPGVEGGKALQALSARLPTDTVTLIVLPELDWRAQKASWFAALDAAGVTVEVKQVTRVQLPAWLANRLRDQQQNTDDETLAFIAERVEGNMLAAYQEMQKLALLFPFGRLTFDQVKDAVLDVARFDVFNLGATVIAGDAAHLARMLDGLKGEGAAPPLVLWVIAEEIRALGRVVTLTSAGRPLAQALRDARIWGPHQTLIEQHARRFTPPQIEAALMHAAQIDRLIKGLAKGDAWDELLKLGLRFSRKPAKAA